MTDLPSLTLSAPAKLNLYLHVIGRRDDGFHLLDSLVAFAAVHDTLVIEPASRLSLENTGTFGSSLPSSSDNLVMRAAERLRDLAGISDGARITLVKDLPVASGIGGGSADAAAAIKGLARLWNIHPGQHDLSGLALGLGADVPVCLFGRPAFMGGIGEQIEPLAGLPAVPLVLVNPGVGVSTPAIFKARRAAFSEARRFDEIPETLDHLVDLLLDGRGNDLSDPALSVQPVIGDVLARIGETEGCRLARMSGSGATCFGLFSTQNEADRAAASIRDSHPGWWAVSTRLLGNLQSN